MSMLGIAETDRRKFLQAGRIIRKMEEKISYWHTDAGGAYKEAMESLREAVYGDAVPPFVTELAAYRAAKAGGQDAFASMLVQEAMGEDEDGTKYRVIRQEIRLACERAEYARMQQEGRTSPGMEKIARQEGLADSLIGKMRAEIRAGTDARDAYHAASFALVAAGIDDGVLDAVLEFAAATEYRTKDARDAIARLD